MKTDLSSYDNSWYEPGSIVKRGLWFVCNTIFFLNPFFPFSSLKCSILRFFGAEVGKGVILKPRINIKYPWLLKIGDFSWIGENVWIDNLALITIGNNVCLSQGCMLLCGNHNYKKTTFDLIADPIFLEDGVWIGAKALVAPGVSCLSHSVLSASSVATSSLEAYTIYQGNPAKKIRIREISE